MIAAKGRIQIMGLLSNYLGKELFFVLEQVREGEERLHIASRVIYYYRLQLLHIFLVSGNLLKWCQSYLFCEVFESVQNETLAKLMEIKKEQ